MRKIMKNKKGTVVLRDIVFIFLIFAGIVALSGILVSEMGREYDNDEMVSSYNQEVIGDDTLEDKSNTWEGIAEDLSGENGIVSMLKGGLEGIGVVLLEVIKAPHTFSKMLTSILDEVGASDELVKTSGFILSSLLYALIVFSIIKVFLKGGDI